jgi:hypothetical protein
MRKYNLGISELDGSIGGAVLRHGRRYITKHVVLAEHRIFDINSSTASTSPAFSIVTRLTLLVRFCVATGVCCRYGSPGFRKRVELCVDMKSLIKSMVDYRARWRAWAS